MSIEKKIEDVPGVAAAEDGVVMLDGPDGVAVAMQPEVARITGERLIVAAGEAEQQRLGSAAPGD